MPCLLSHRAQCLQDIFDSRPIARPVIDTRAIDNARTVDNSAAVARHGSLERSLDRIRHEGVVVHGSPISRPLEGRSTTLGTTGLS